MNAATDSLEEVPYHTLVLSGEHNQTGVAIHAIEDETELVLVSDMLELHIEHTH